MLQQTRGVSTGLASSQSVYTAQGTALAEVAFLSGSAVGRWDYGALLRALCEPVFLQQRLCEPVMLVCCDSPSWVCRMEVSCLNYLTVKSAAVLLSCSNSPHWPSRSRCRVSAATQVCRRLLACRPGIRRTGIKSRTYHLWLQPTQAASVL